MTDAEKNRKVAEACRYAIVDGWEVYAGGKLLGHLIDNPDGYQAFTPLTDANQAIAALDKVFGKHWALDRRPEGVWVGSTLNKEREAIGPDFCAAAVAAILAAKGLL